MASPRVPVWLPFMKNPQATDKQATMSSELPANHPKTTRLANPRTKPIGKMIKDHSSPSTGRQG